MQCAGAKESLPGIVCKVRIARDGGIQEAFVMAGARLLRAPISDSGRIKAVEKADVV
jgi:hypothetical protein